MDLFVFDLSFANWLVPFIVVGVASVLFSEISYLLGAASILVLSGAVSLWVIPFVLTSQAVFYDTLRGGGTGRPQSGRYSGQRQTFNRSRCAGRPAGRPASLFSSGPKVPFQPYQHIGIDLARFVSLSISCRPSG